MEEAKSEARKLLRSLHLEEAVSEMLPEDVLARGSHDDILGGFFQMQECQIEVCVNKAVTIVDVSLSSLGHEVSFFIRIVYSVHDRCIS